MSRTAGQERRAETVEWIEPEIPKSDGDELRGRLSPDGIGDKSVPADTVLSCPMDAVNHTLLSGGDDRFLLRVLLGLAAAAVLGALLYFVFP